MRESDSSVNPGGSLQAKKERRVRRLGAPGRWQLYFFTLTLKPAACRALTSSPASKSPVTSNESSFGLAVSPVTPSTFLMAALMALQQAPQQLWAPVRERLLTLPLGASVSAFMARSLLSVSP